jgi:hypothetical protein
LHFIPDGEVLAISWKDGESMAFASKESDVALFNENWGDTKGLMLIKAPVQFVMDQGTVVNRNDLIPLRGVNNISIQIVQELNVPMRDFGTAFWGIVSQQMIQHGFSLDSFGNLRHIKYSDRHLKTPLSFILLSRIILSNPFAKAEEFELVISTLQSDYFYKDGFRSLIHSWFREEEESRKELIEALLRGMSEVNYILGQNRRDLLHARELNLEFENGRVLNIRLDQGMGFWNPSFKPQYPFNDSVADQMHWIEENINRLRTLNGDTHTYIDIKID